MKFFRAPGAKVRYTSYETRNYVSRKARVSRGYHISPTRRDRTADGWRFWFFSPRGPAADGGHWQVEAVRADGGGGDGGDGGGGGPGWNCVSGSCEYSATNGTYATLAECEAARIPVEDPMFTGGQCAKPYDVTVALSGGGSRYRRVAGPIGGFRTVFTGADTFVQAFCSGTNNGTSCIIPDGGLQWRNFPAIFGNRSIVSISISVPNCGLGTEDNCGNLVIDYECPVIPPPPDPDPGSGGGVPPGFLPGEGPWAYACSCPDYTGDESPYRVATAPSHRTARSWGQIRPESPCKHMVSAARSLGDQKTLLDWVRRFAADSPGREFTSSPTIALDNSYNQAQRELEAAFRRTTRTNRQALAKVRRAERSQAALMQNLGTIFRLDAYGSYQGKRDNYGVPLDLEALDNRWNLYESTDSDQLLQGYNRTDTNRRIAAYDREQRRIQREAAAAAPFPVVPRTPPLPPSFGDRARAAPGAARAATYGIMGQATDAIANIRANGPRVPPLRAAQPTYNPNAYQPPAGDY